MGRNGGRHGAYPRNEASEVNFEEKLREVALPVRLLDHAIGALANEGVDAPAGAFLKAHDRAGGDLWEALEYCVHGFGELSEVHDDELSEALRSGQSGSFRTAVAFYLGHDVAQAITDDEIATINADVFENLYSELPVRDRSLTALSEAVVRLLTILDRRTMCLGDGISAHFAAAREDDLQAVKAAEEVRARPSITERIREHRVSSRGAAAGAATGTHPAGEMPDPNAA